MRSIESRCERYAVRSDVCQLNTMAQYEKTEMQTSEAFAFRRGGATERVRDDFLMQSIKKSSRTSAVRDDDGAGYGNRTRLLGLGSRCTTDVLILLMNFLLALCASYGNPSAARPPSCPAHFLVALPKAAMLRIPAVCRRLNACARTAVPVWSADHYRCTNPALPLSYHLFRKKATAI